MGSLMMTSPKFGINNESKPKKQLRTGSVSNEEPIKVFSGRKWSIWDMGTAGVILGLHLLSLYGPFYCNWAAFWVAFTLYIITGLFGITLSFHRNLSHHSFKLPKWLEYFFAYCGTQALQSGSPNIVLDLENQRFYKFLQNTYILHPIALGVVLYALGGLPFVVWGMVGINNLKLLLWWVALLAYGEGWHNNHHAFEYSARHGLEWWQIDTTWYVVKLLHTIGLATKLKLPTKSHKQRLMHAPTK
ncbi:hypothetical protein CsatA_021886 [Cannabis sativa]